MKHGVKRLVALLTALVMICASAAVSASATDAVTDTDSGDITAEETLEDSNDIEDSPVAVAAAPDNIVINEVLDVSDVSDTPDSANVIEEGTAGGSDNIDDNTVTATVTAPDNITEREALGDPGISGAVRAENIRWYSEPFTISYPYVTLSNDVINQTKYIFANSEYNSLDKMPECAGTITGTYKGKTVTLIPDWKKPGGLFNGLKGSCSNGATGYFGTNNFTATTFTVKETNERVQLSPDQEMTLNVWVIAVDATLSFDGYTNNEIIVTKSQALAVQNEEDLQRLLKLPTQAGVTYQPEQVSTGTENLTQKAQDAETFNQPDGFYNIINWEISSYNVNLDTERLRNLAGEVTNTNKSVTLLANCENPPEWASVMRGTQSFTLTITPDSPAQITVAPPKDITYGQTLGQPSATATVGSGGEPDENYLSNGYFITIYANSKYNQSAKALLDLVRERKGSYTIGGKTYQVTWRADSGNPAFRPKGYEENVWYTYSGALAGRPETAKAYVRVIPVNATLLNFNTYTNSKTMKAADITALTNQNWKEVLGLPTGVIFKNEPAQKDDVGILDKQDEFPVTAQQSYCSITGWKMDGKDLTLDALKQKASGVTSVDTTVTLTPVYQTVGWATVKSNTPTFQLIITPKIPVDVLWNGPSGITYGGQLSLDTPTQNAKPGGTIDESGSFSWQYIYYKEDGTKLGMPPADVGKYRVQAILVSRTHSGTSALKEFEIKAKSIGDADFTFTPPADIGNLIYNTQPQTPVYTVKDGNKTVRKNTDYKVAYSDNTNAGTAKVTFTGMGNYTGMKEETFTIQKLPLTAAQKPVISGSAACGQVLSASLDGVDASELEWLWAVDGVTVAGSAAVSYEVRPEDSNKVITVTAKAKDSGNYSGTSGVSDGMTVAKLKVAGTVSITGTTADADGRIVAGTTLDAEADVIPDAAKNGGVWSWKVNGTIKEGAADSTYTVVDSDKEIVAIFTPNKDYIGNIESAMVEVGKILLTGAVSAAKEPADADPIAVGSRLKATVNHGPSSAQFIYVWLRDGEPIPGAAGEVYTITAADRGKTISVKVTAQDYTCELVSKGTAIPAVKPDVPADVQVKAGDGLLDISWNAPDDNGGAPITGYKLIVKQGNNIILERDLAANVLSYRLEGLVNGVEYSVSVRAFNRIGDGKVGEISGTPSAPADSGGDNGGNSGSGSGGNSGSGSGGSSGSGSGGNSGSGNGGYAYVGGAGYTDVDGDGKVGVTVKKVWKLDDDGSATKAVMVLLLRDGEEYEMIKLSSQNDWTHTWTGLDNSYTWTVEEVNVPNGFTAKVEQKAGVFIITNNDKPVAPGKPIDDILQKVEEPSLILVLTILIICGIGMIVVLRNKRREYKEKSFRE